MRRVRYARAMYVKDVTAWVPTFGGLTFPCVTASHISAAGTSASVHRTVKRGESQRTIDEGSSYRTRRFSKLRGKDQCVWGNRSIERRRTSLGYMLRLDAQSSILGIIHGLQQCRPVG
jgi:hypothetical protein